MTPRKCVIVLVCVLWSRGVGRHAPSDGKLEPTQARYFECAPNHGLFARPKKLERPLGESISEPFGWRERWLGRGGAVRTPASEGAGSLYI